MSNTEQIMDRVYAIGATAGYTIQQTFPEIPLTNEVYVQDALQLRIGADYLNRKLGIVKDPSNTQVLEINYDTSNNMLVQNTITIDTLDILTLVNVEHVI